MTTRSSTSSTIRVLRDTTSQDGYIAKTQSGRICFIGNISDCIGELAPGQLWAYKIVREQPRYDVVELTGLSKA